MKTSTAFAVLVLMTAVSSAQAPPTTFVLEPFVTVKGAPYSGEEIRETQANGSPIVQRCTRKIFRDSQGRERIERTLVPIVVGVANPEVPPVVIDIRDPVAGFQFTLEPAKRTAARIKLPEAPSFKSAQQPIGQSLGTREIEGISAEGHLETMTSSQAAPAVIRLETWMSPELEILLLAKLVTRSGTEETRMTKLSRFEPPPELFRLPPDYTTFEQPRAVKMGPGVSPPIPTSKLQPEYTPAARAAGIQGDVIASVVVGADGLPYDIRVTRSLDPGLDQKAIEALSKWRFRPGQKDGQPVAVQVTIQVNFRP